MCDGTASGSCVGSCTYGGNVCSGAMWVDGGGGRAHQSPVTVQVYTHHCLQYSQHKGDSPLPSHQLPPVPAHSSSQVVHCRVCPPRPQHAPVLVLHLAVYPTSPTFYLNAATKEPSSNFVCAFNHWQDYSWILLFCCHGNHTVHHVYSSLLSAEECTGVL